MKPLSSPNALLAPERAEALHLAEGEVDVWRVALDDQTREAVEFMATLLSADETERARRFYFDRDRRRYVVGRGVLRLTLGRYLGRAPQDIRFRYGPSGKPALIATHGAQPPIHFNVAHSEGIALYAFTRVGEVGVDVELMRDLPDWEQVAEAAFSPRELQQLKRCPQEWRRNEFFKAWTRQEAVLKAHGIGLGEVKAASVEAAFNVYPLEPAPGYVAAIATTSAAKQPRQIRVWGETTASAAAPTPKKTTRSAPARSRRKQHELRSTRA